MTFLTTEETTSKQMVRNKSQRPKNKGLPDVFSPRDSDFVNYNSRKSLNKRNQRSSKNKLSPNYSFEQSHSDKKLDVKDLNIATGSSNSTHANRVYNKTSSKKSIQFPVIKSPIGAGAGPHFIQSPESRLLKQKLLSNRLKSNKKDIEILMQSFDRDYMTNSNLLQEISKKLAKNKVQLDR